MEKNQTNCLDCAIMNGQMRFDGFYSTIEGVCPQDRLWNITGGYGGGGATCGPGGGGGAGFYGIFYKNYYLKNFLKAVLVVTKHLVAAVPVLLYLL